MSKIKTVGVIGGGPGGIAAAKEFIEQGFTVTVWEGSGDLGGQWNDQCPTSGMWRNLYTNSSPRLMEFTDYPWNEIANDETSLRGLFPHYAKVYEYLNAFADKFGVRQRTKFNTKVTKVEQHKSGWKVFTSDGNVEEVDALSVCCGRYNCSRNPLTTPGKGALEHYTGEMYHSAEVGRKLCNGELKGKKVLVAGNSISGVELVRFAVIEGASLTAHSIRKQRYYFDKISTLESKNPERAYDELLFRRVSVWLDRVAPEKIKAFIQWKFFKSNFPTQPGPAIGIDKRWKPDGDTEKAGSTVGYGYMECLKDKTATFRGTPKSCNGKMITFCDGTTEEFDVVIAATGYKLDVDFLPQEVRDSVLFYPHGNAELCLFNQTLHPDWPTLAFVGLPSIVGAHFPVAELQARWTGQYFLGNYKMPPRSKVEKHMKQWKEKKMLPGSTSQRTMTIYLQEDIAEELKILPSIWLGLWYFRILTWRPLFPIQYRLSTNMDKPEVIQAAWERLKMYNDTIQLANDENGKPRRQPPVSNFFPYLMLLLSVIFPILLSVVLLNPRDL